ncbi:1-acyl-sn-glycerol-3-phosphate acyltransferase [Mycoplasmopsis bovirhinis]|uniref:lysophospholipid acyltransferase family protein n=1 Tax=Mycoplasmopsis bovirhinis TaxID=29553 RepID=UPI000C05C60E|nr:lysophospholipid acyltransferase family protein [Mycoplasmopsis bovirhinis]ATO30838.1 1-acyl-sn-glycerol-3-phosphate acyltransferase [Mycoplasmopsis bovirhinis]
MTIIPKIKMILFSILWFFRFISIKRLAKKYKKTPDFVPVYERYHKLSYLSKKILKIYNIDLTVKGIDNLPKSGAVLLTPNHKSYTDVLALMVALQKQDHQENSEQRIPTFVAKEELGKSFTIKHAIKLLDTFLLNPNDFRNSLKTLNSFGDYIRDKKTFGIIFPEAHRIKTKELGEFKTGAFKVALQKFIPIVPVAISGTLDSFNSSKTSRTKVTVNFLPMIKARDIIGQEAKALATRVQNLIQAEINKNE